ncbi:hypothetical protein ABZ484_18175 [Streptomyces sp. NPDC006393]|uniref:hypothetical protein n=1 Tax=Streptomyces sp. NPDC006393 TaxID=3156763 RepID=UPI0033CB7F12
MGEATDEEARNIAQLQERLTKLEGEVKKKSDEHDKATLPGGAEFDKEDVQLKWTDYLTILAVAKAVSVIKLELPALLDAGKLVETGLERITGKTRNQWGWLFGQKPVPPEELINNAKREIQSIYDPKLETLTRRTQSLTDRLENTRTALSNTNRRLQQTSDALRAQQRTTRRGVQELPRQSAAGSLDQAAQLRELETRVNGLIRVLGS